MECGYPRRLQRPTSFAGGFTPHSKWHGQELNLPSGNVIPDPLRAVVGEVALPRLAHSASACSACRVRPPLPGSRDSKWAPSPLTSS